MTDYERVLDEQLQEAISLLKGIYNDRIENQEMRNIEEFLEEIGELK